MAKGFQVAHLFSNHMVLQREKQIVVWGDGINGEHIVVECAGLSAETNVSNGRWSVSLGSAVAGGPYELTVRCGEEQFEFVDVWFGDVWIAGGQSNMEWSLRDT